MSDQSTNPYDSGHPDLGMSPPNSSGTPKSTGGVKAAGITLMVVAGLNVCHAIFGIVNTWGEKSEVPPNLQDRPDLKPLVDFMVEYTPLINVGLPIFFILMSLLMMYGAFKMTKLQSYGMAMVAAIIAITPFNGILDCCLIEVGVGIWAIVMVTSAKSLFR